ncbi:MAG: ArsC/Spx/MgsR family protein [Pseudomonadota bacterium]
MTKLYGLKNCDTCRKARKALEAAGHVVNFVDVRDNPPPDEVLSHWLDQFGPALLNTRSTTWRGLTDDERQAEPLDLLQQHPTLMKRPVIEHDGAVHLGWGKPVQATLGVS